MKLENLNLLAFPGGAAVKNALANAGNARDVGSVPGLERFPGRQNGNPLQCACLGNPHGQRSLVGYSPWGCKESDTTEHACTRIPVASISSF